MADDLLVVDLQTDLIGLEASRIVAPLRDAERYVSFPGLTPVIEIKGRRLVAQVQDQAAVPAAALGARVASASEQGDVLLRAIDILTHGF
jgi:toxin CcdB